MQPCALPLILPYAWRHALMVMGPPGVGKTPFARVWSYILCRYQIECQDMTDRREVQIRRGGRIENFHNRAQAHLLVSVALACVGP